MDTEDQIFVRFEAELANIAAVDRLYYTNPSLTANDRSEFAARQLRLEDIRSRFYAALADIRQYRKLRRCRSRIHISQRYPNRWL
jgi:hypothetical protein